MISLYFIYITSNRDISLSNLQSHVFVYTEQTQLIIMRREKRKLIDRSRSMTVIVIDHFFKNKTSK